MKSNQKKRATGKARSASKKARRKPKPIDSALYESETRFRDLVELSSDWYWEQDEHFRFTSRAGKALDKAGLSIKEGLGKKRWELPYVGVTKQQWDEHKATLEAHKPFSNLILRRYDVAGQLRWLSINGRPIFDRSGKFKGYRGTGRDITEQREYEESLLQFRTAIDATADGIHLLDYETMRFIDVNKTACVYLGYTRDEFLKLAIPDIAPGAD
ncbi:MAG TPA: PAS domain S-box protein, partial [Burkholderiales bacterium]|nr:PAS domain S-box protein [Burkholderiales bacterium]